MTILVITKDPAMEHRIRSALGTSADHEVFHFDGLEAADDALSRHTDLCMVVIEHDLDGFDGLKAVEKLSRRRQDCKILLLLNDSDLSVGRHALDIGATVTAPISITSDALSAILNLMASKYKLQLLPDDGQGPARRDPSSRLSKRELQILALLCDGQQNKEIAHSFGIQEVTVKMHMRAIIRKLGARNRTHAAMIATRDELV